MGVNLTDHLGLSGRLSLPIRSLRPAREPQRLCRSARQYFPSRPSVAEVTTWQRETFYGKPAVHLTFLYP